MKMHDSFVSACKQAIKTEGNLNKFAQKTGLNYSTLYRWLNGTQSPTLKDVEALLPFIDWPPCEKTVSDNTEIQQLKSDLAREQDRVALLKDILISKLGTDTQIDTSSQPVEKIR